MLFSYNCLIPIAIVAIPLYVAKIMDIEFSSLNNKRIKKFPIKYVKKAKK